MTNWYSIIMMIGPSGAGKSYFYQNVLLPQIEKLRDSLDEPLRVVYLSSDEIRRQILGFHAHKMSPEMMAVSPEAFKILLDRLTMSTSYPHNAHLVIVDSTGLSEDFRKQVAEVAYQNHYNLEAVVFDYKEISEYLPSDGVEDEYSYQQKRVSSEHVKRLRQDVLKTLSKKTYQQVHKIKSKAAMADFTVNLNPQELNKFFFPKNTYTVIGDIHGCIEEFLALLNKLQVKITDGLITEVPEAVGQLVLIGDLIDKGPHSGAVVEFVYANIDKFLLVQGNHEQFVVNEFKKSSGLDENFKKEYFNSFYELTADQKTKLEKIYERAYNFIKTPNFILTHAPVQKKYLGKLDSRSQKLMRKTPFMKSKKDFSKNEEYIQYAEEQFSYLQSEKHRHHPLHIFGHLAFPRAMKWENKIAVDSGAVYGGYLTAVTVSPTGRVNFTALKTPEKVPYSPEGIIAPFVEKVAPKTVELSSFDLERIKTLAQNQVQFVSGTISPADRDLDTNNLESLAKALTYYQNKNVKEVVLETKHMGSRGNIYLHQQVADCRAVSRNGFLVKQNLDAVFTKLLAKHLPRMQAEKIKTLIIDGELMPWSLMGKGLIKDQYEVVGYAVQSELDLLQANGFSEALAAVMNHPRRAEFQSEVHTTSKKKMIDKYGYQLYHSLVAVSRVNLNLAKDLDHIQKYNQQVALYGNEGEIDFLPFMLLKTIYEDGREVVHLNETEKTKDNYRLVSDQEFLVVDLTQEDFLVKAQAFFDKQVAKGEEGIVVKPEFTYIPGIVPFLKVRNPEYLRIIYGYNYLEPEIYQGLVQSKKVGKKMRISANEYTIAKKMLEIPVSQISENNEEYVKLLSQMIVEEQEEQKVDYRL